MRREAPDETTVLQAPSDESDASQRTPGMPHMNGAAPVALPGSPIVSMESETIVLRARRHGRHLTFPVIAILAIAGASGFFIGTLPESWMNLLALAAAAFLAIFLGIAPIFAWLSRRAVVTTRRVIVHRGFFVRHRSEVSLARVREVRSKQNPIQRLFGSGDIDLYVGAESTRIHDVPGVKDLHAAIQQLSEKSYDEHMRATGFGF